MSPDSSSCFSVTQSPPLGLSSVIQSLSYIFSEPSPLLVFYLDFSMVRTWGGSRLRPRVRSVHPSVRPQLRSRPQYHIRSLRQSLRSLRDFVDIRHGWDTGPHRLCLRGELGRPGPPSGPAHQAQASHLPPDLSHHQSHQLQRRHHRLSCHLPPGSGGCCS